MTDLKKADFVSNLFRSVGAFFAQPAFWLLGIVYQIFFNISTADLFNNATVLGFYKRVQLIIGVFMIFQLAVTILKGIVSPDEAFGSKSGLGTIITRVIFALILLTVLVPVSIPGATTEYERQINNNGLLFGTLYSLQHRLLSNNTIGRLVLGTSSGATSDGSSNTGLTGADKQAEELSRSSRIFTSTVLKGFIRINLVPEEDRSKMTDGRTEEMDNDNRVCKDIDDDILSAYTKIDADPGEILDLINEKCTISKNEPWYNGSRDKYVFAERIFVGAIVGFVFVFILLSFCFDIAVRAVKLAVLRIIAPIPIISYMDPKGGKDGALNSWIKALTSTYIDLFVRLAVVYFVIYLIQDMIVNGTAMNTSGMVGILSVIAIWIGLFLFAKEAPKFIRQVLGMKEDSGKGIFGGLRGAANITSRAAAIGATALGAVGSFNASRRASKMADDANGVTEKLESANFARKLMNKGKHVVAGILGGAGEVATGVKTAATSKEQPLSKTMENIQKRNAKAISRGAAGSTTFGRAGTSMYRLVVGEDKYEQEARQVEHLKGISTTGKDLKEYLEDRAVKKGGSLKLAGYRTDATGKRIGFTTTLDEWKNAFGIAQQRGNATFTVAGQTFETFGSEAKSIDGQLVTAAGKQWANIEKSKGASMDPALRQKVESFEDSGGAAQLANPADIFDSDAVKNVAVKAGGDADRIERSAAYQKHKADHGATGGNKGV